MNDETRKKLLVADNSEEYRRSLFGYLELEGYDHEEAGTIDEALKKLETEPFDLTLADLRMRDDDDPNDMRGLEIAKRSSKLGIPCVIVTAFTSAELARKAMRSVDGEAFAKDVISKAGGVQAVVDVINTILKPKEAVPARPDVKGFVFDAGRKILQNDGQDIKLSRNPLLFFEALAKKDGGVCTYAELIEFIYEEKVTNAQAVNDTRLKKLVDRIKKKIGDTGPGPQYIETVPGMGYRLNRRN